MGQDDADEGGLGDGCLEHDFVEVDFHTVRRNGMTGMAITQRCRFCPAEFYEPSNLDLFPETNGLDPRL